MNVEMCKKKSNILAQSGVTSTRTRRGNNNVNVLSSPFPFPTYLLEQTLLRQQRAGNGDA